MAAQVERRPVISDAGSNNYEEIYRGWQPTTYADAVKRSNDLDWASFYASHLKWDFQNNDLDSVGQLICSLTPSERSELKLKYEEVTGERLEDDIKTYTDGSFRKVLLNFVSKPVEQSGPDVEMPDVNELQQLSNAVYEMGLDGYREEYLINTVTEKSPEFLKATMDYSQQMDLFHINHDHSQLEPAKRALMTMVKCSADRAKYFAGVLNKAIMDPNQIDHKTIVRVITTRAKLDMNDIKSEYANSFNRLLHEDVKTAFSEFEYKNDLANLLDYAPN